MINLLLALINFSPMLMGTYSLNVFPPPLSKEEEEKYIKKMNNGDKEARNVLIERNLRLVAHLVKKFNVQDNQDDLIGVGTIGLIKGIDTYKPSKNTRITTYAARCIQNEILMYFRSNKKVSQEVSLSDSIGYDKEGNEMNLIDVLKTDEPDLVDIIHNDDLIDKMNKYMNVLTEREKEILEKRYGLNNQKEMTQKEIAKKMNISRSYVSRIEKRALSKLLKEFLNHN